MTQIQVVIDVRIPFDEELSRLHDQSDEGLRKEVLEDVKQLFLKEMVAITDGDCDITIAADFKEASE